MQDLEHKLEDFPDNPDDMDWDKEALLFYYHMMNQEEKYEKKVKDILDKFKKVFEGLEKSDIVTRKAVYNELKMELYKLKGSDHDFERSLYYILLMTRIVNGLEDELEQTLSKKEQVAALQSIIESDNLKEEIEKLESSQDTAIDQATNELTRVTRTESWRYVNEQRLDEFRQKGYKYKTTYPVKDEKTCADSWYYYYQKQVKPIDEPFNYTWKGKERVFMAPPDRPNDRNVLIPYTGDMEKYHNDIGKLTGTY